MSSLPSDSGASPFWRFSLGFYARPGAAPACLGWQDRAAADVNLVLYLLFAAAHCRALRRAEVAHLDAVMAPWRTRIVRPLRAVRRGLKEAIGAFDADATAGLRRAVKRVELDAERLAQTQLERIAPVTSLGTHHPDRAGAARCNLDAYLEFLGDGDRGAADILLDIFTAEPMPP
ncbi:MAG: TIGR02444 family protein [Alphaproteobacteria bacterium]|nr:TIGR02444 family protein [Alphaproteobacteria bacterium]